MKITMNNGNDPAYTAMFEELIREVFHFSFAPWLAENLWDDKYESYSVIESGVMLANVCIYKTDMLVNGKPIHAHQFGGVATRPGERGKGLARLLMNHILKKYPSTPAFLGANDSVADFYQQFGFRRVQTYTPIIDILINNKIINNGLKCHANNKIVRKALYGKQVYSNLVDSINTQSVKICQQLTNPAYMNHIYFLPDCGALIIARQKGEVLFLSDAISPHPLSFDELAKQLPFSGVTRVEFGFCPDWLGVKPRWEPSDELYFIRGEWDLPKYFRFPALSET
jgi:GNAT superfamily N-acetyltransferase